MNVAGEEFQLYIQIIYTKKGVLPFIDLTKRFQRCYNVTSRIAGRRKMTPVIRIDDEVMNELKKRAVDFGLVFEPPNATLRRILGLGPRHISNPISRRQIFGTKHTAMPVKDTVTGQVYPSKYKAGLVFKYEFPGVNERYIWYALLRKYPSRFVEVATGKVL